MNTKSLSSIFSKIVAVSVLTASCQAQGDPQDNYKSNAVVTKRSTNTNGVHVDHVIVDSGGGGSGGGTGATASTTIATGQATLSTTASQVVASNSARHTTSIRNLDASISIYIGAAGVTSSTGHLIKAGEAFTVVSTAAVYAVAASGTPAVSHFDEND